MLRIMQNQIKLWTINSCNDRFDFFTSISRLVSSPEWIHSSPPGSPARKHTHHQRTAAKRCQAQRYHCGAWTDAKMQTHTLTQTDWRLIHCASFSRMVTLLWVSLGGWATSPWWTRWGSSLRRSLPPQRSVTHLHHIQFPLESKVQGYDIEIHLKQSLNIM